MTLLSHRPVPRRSAALLCALLALCPISQARSLRLFVIGNSFTQNATQFLPAMAQAGGHELVMGAALRGGASLEEHWRALEAYLAHREDAKAKIYEGKSLHELIDGRTWDLITIQQYSLLSSDPATYWPFAKKLAAHLKAIQPTAELLIHQTWAYRRDAQQFGQVSAGRFAADQKEMWESSRAAYWQLARQLKARVIPVGDAFWKIDSDPRSGFRPDATFKESAAQFPDLPGQRYSLHEGYRWASAPGAQPGLLKDFTHANVAGKYLGALVWYGVLFGESPEHVTFVPDGIIPEFAAELRKAAADVIRSHYMASSRTALAAVSY